MLKSLNTRIIIVVIGIILITTITIMYFVHKETRKVIFNVQDENARNILNTVLLSVENEYKSLLFHKKTMIERRNAELKNVITIAFRTIQDFHKRAKQGEFSEKVAKKYAISFIKNLRYDKGVGYIWINDTGSPYPKMIIHPTIPELNGKILNDKKFNCALGIRKNLFQAFVEICTSKDEGYVDYLWPKPTSNGLSEEKPKTSFGKLFKEWGWILGTGIYIDDIEQDIKKRHGAILKELEQTFKKIRVANSGYMYLFDHKQRMVIHPSLEGADFSNLENPVTGNPILEDLIAAEKTERKQLDYLWEKPPDHIKDFRFWKRSYVVYFEPLKWYIASSVYFDEKNKPAYELQNSLVFISAIYVGIGLLLSLVLSQSLATPLSKLMHAARNIEKKGLSSDSIPITGTIETKELGTIFTNLIKSLQYNISEKEVLLKEIHHRVKNNMAVIISLIGLQARNIKDIEVKEALKDSQSRIRSMALIHESLYQSDQLSEIHLQKYVADLVKIVITAMQIKGKVETKIYTKDVKLTINQAVPCGLIINELITNAFKHAFTGSLNVIDISASYIDNKKKIRLVIKDNGSGLPEDFKIDDNISLGMRIISLLVENQLEGEWHFKNDGGACFTLEWPIEEY
ncbi:MAG: hypothetical protein GY714_08750 [Desulfobacterales bacterium]|nr:hypothetical protein [Desulfobacterales bacterium]